MVVKGPSRCFVYLASLSIVFLIVSCTPALPATPTLEIFNRLNPSPTPFDSSLPLTCQRTDSGIYLNKEWGYCFAYPTVFTIDESRAAEGILSLYGPPLENNTDPARVSLEIRTQLVPENSQLAPLVDAFLVPFQSSSDRITRETRMLADTDAEKLEPIPGLFSSRLILALHKNVLFTLRFQPMNFSSAKLDLNELTQTVNSSFAFLPEFVPPSPKPQVIRWSEFGQNISVIYNPLLAPWVEAQTVPAVPMSGQILFAESHPAYAQIRFVGFQGGRVYELPLLPFENRVAQIMVFQTEDFPGFDDANPQGFVNQLQALKDVLKRRGELPSCAQPITGKPAQPFLPWINAKQSFCAQPQIVEFVNGRGVRYLTHYAQDPSPVLDQQVFYTFQGLTEDEQFYVSALFPVETGIFPVEPPDCPQCGQPEYDPFAELLPILTEQLAQLNAQAEDDFAPSLKVLDGLITSIQISN